MLLVLNLPLAPAWAKLLQIPRPYLYAGILFFATMGAYAVNAQPFDLFLLLALGLLGFAMRRFGLPVLPLIVGVILGPLAEKQGRRALQLSGGDISGLLGGPVAWVCYAIIAVVLFWPLVAKVDPGVPSVDEAPTDVETAQPGGLRMTVLVGYVPTRSARRRHHGGHGPRRGEPSARGEHVPRRRPGRCPPRREEPTGPGRA